MDRPDDVRVFGRGRLEVVEMNDAAFGRIVYEPGWRWTVDVRPIAQTELCEIHHMGYVISGQLHMELRDGASIEAVAGDVFECPPGHDAWVIGNDPWISIDWAGRRHYARPLRDASSDRRLATILFTDLVDSTKLAASIGDSAWRDRLSDYNVLIQQGLEKHHGREIDTTGDGVLAIFESPAHAVYFALDLAEYANNLGLQQRAGMHTGEIEFVGDNVRGIAVHLAARVAAAAGSGEVFMSATTNALLLGSDIHSVSRGSQSLKGIEQPVELFAVE